MLKKRTFTPAEYLKMPLFSNARYSPSLTMKDGDILNLDVAIVFAADFTFDPETLLGVASFFTEPKVLETLNEQAEGADTPKHVHAVRLLLGILGLAKGLTKEDSDGQSNRGDQVGDVQEMQDAAL